MRKALVLFSWKMTVPFRRFSLITDGEGRGISRATIVLTDSGGKTLKVRSNSFGYFNFSEVVAGRKYVASVSSRRFSFEPITVTGGVSELDLTADP